MTYVAHQHTSGAEVAQHHDSRYPLAARMFPAACRVIDRGEDGEPVRDPDADGDYVCRRHWPAATRAHGAWAPAWPVIGSEGYASSREAGAAGAGGATGPKGVPAPGEGGGGGATSGGSGAVGDPPRPGETGYLPRGLGPLGPGGEPYSGYTPTDTYYANPGTNATHVDKDGNVVPDLPSSLGGRTYEGAPSYANGGDYYGDTPLMYDSSRGVWIGPTTTVRNPGDIFPQSGAFGVVGSGGGGGGGLDIDAAVRGGGGGGGGGGSFASFLGPVNVRVTPGNLPLFNAGQGGKGPGTGAGKYLNGKTKRERNGAAEKAAAKKAAAGGAAGAAGAVGAAGSSGFANHRPATAITGDTPNGLVVHPIGHGGYGPDGRFEGYVQALPNWWPAFPLNWVGIGMAATIETRQDNLFMPTDPRLVAVNKAGDPAMGSWVCDLRPNDTADCTGPNPTYDGRAAPLHSLVRVVKMPNGTGGNALAWQLTLSGQDGRYGCGLAYGRTVEEGMRRHATGTKNPGSKVVGVGPTNPLGGATEVRYAANDSRATVSVSVAPAAPSKYVVATFAQEAGGPLSLGAANDKHHDKRTTRDGEPWNCGHLATSACFFRNEIEDGPFRFEHLDYPKCTSYPHDSHCFIAWDPEDPYEHLGIGMKGRWRIFTTVPFYTSDGKNPKDPPTTGTPPGPGIPPPNSPNPPTSGDPPTTGTPGEGISTLGLSVNAQGEAEEQIFSEDFWVVSGEGEVRYPDHPSRDPWPAPRQLSPRASAVVLPYPQGSGLVERHVAQPMTTAFSSLLFRAQDATLGAHDARRTGSSVDDRRRPTVLRAEAFGAHGSDWIYSEVPGASRFAGGIAAGGVLLTRPAADLADAATAYAPPGAALPTAYFAAGPGVRFAGGVPHKSGAIASGAEWYVDGSGDLVVAKTSSAAVATESFRVLNATGKVQVAVGVAFGGVTSSDVYLEKDASGVLAVRVGDDSGYGGLKADNVTVLTAIDGTTAVVTAKEVVLPERGGAPTALANKAILFADDDGGGVTQVLARFPNGITGELARDFGADFSQAHYTNAGSPEGVVAAPPRAICWDTTNDQLFFKESGTGNTGWAFLALRPATQIVETGGPTTLSFGSIPNGTWLRRVGTTVVGHTPPTITGSRGGNVALGNLLTAGATMGLWVNSTTA